MSEGKFAYKAAQNNGSLYQYDSPLPAQKL